MSCRPPVVGWFEVCRIARRRKLFLGAEFERGAKVQANLFAGPPMERRREFAAANLQAWVLP